MFRPADAPPSALTLRQVVGRATRLERSQQPGAVGSKERRPMLRTLLAGISVLAPNSPTLYTPLSTDSSTIFLFVWAQGSGKGSVCPNAGPTTVDHGLPISFCQDSPPSPFGSGSISPLPQPQLSRRKRQPGDALEHTAKQPFRQVALRQQQPVIAGMFHQPSARLHQPLL